MQSSLRLKISLNNLPKYKGNKDLVPLSDCDTNQKVTQSIEFSEATLNITFDFNKQFSRIYKFAQLPSFIGIALNSNSSSSSDLKPKLIKNISVFPKSSEGKSKQSWEERFLTHLQHLPDMSSDYWPGTQTRAPFHNNLIKHDLQEEETNAIVRELESEIKSNKNTLDSKSLNSNSSNSKITHVKGSTLFDFSGRSCKEYQRFDIQNLGEYKILDSKLYLHTKKQEKQTSAEKAAPDPQASSYFTNSSATKDSSSGGYSTTVTQFPTLAPTTLTPETISSKASNPKMVTDISHRYYELFSDIYKHDWNTGKQTHKPIFKYDPKQISNLFANNTNYNANPNTNLSYHRRFSEFENPLAHYDSYDNESWNQEMNWEDSKSNGNELTGHYSEQKSSKKDDETSKYSKTGEFKPVDPGDLPYPLSVIYITYLDNGELPTKNDPYIHLEDIPPEYCFGGINLQHFREYSNGVEEEYRFKEGRIERKCVHRDKKLIGLYGTSKTTEEQDIFSQGLFVIGDGNENGDLSANGHTKASFSEAPRRRLGSFRDIFLKETFKYPIERLFSHIRSILVSKKRAKVTRRSSVERFASSSPPNVPVIRDYQDALKYDNLQG